MVNIIASSLSHFKVDSGEQNKCANKQYTLAL